MNLVLIILVFKAVSAGYFNGSNSDDSSSYYNNFDEQNTYYYGAFDEFYNEDSSGSRKNSSAQNCNKCGIVHGSNLNGIRVVNGKPVQPVYKYPWIVSLMTKNKIKCGGALISSSAILTAGHCVLNKQKVRSASHCKRHKIPPSCFHPPNAFQIGLLRAREETPTDSESVAIKKIIPHPKYSYRLKIYDIAILLLAKPVKCGTYTSPVCLPREDNLTLGTLLIVAGYGRNTPEGRPGPKVLREGSVKVINPRRCVKSKQPRNAADRVVCASGEESKQASCLGDSGSALFGKFGNKMYAVGLVSRGKCNPRRHTTYTKIAASLTFIMEHVKDLPQNTVKEPTS